MTALSAIKYYHHDECVTLRDLDLMFRLERNKDRHWTEIQSPADKIDWENRLIEVADESCRQTSQKLGPELTNLVSHERHIADQFVAITGDLVVVLDREFAYLNETSLEQQQRIKSWSWHRNDNQLLACHLLLRLATEVDCSLLSNCDGKLRDNVSLRRLMHMIADHVAECRARFRS